MEFFDDLGANALKPSLFELVAQEQLRDLLQPALKYVLSFFAQRYPRYLLRIVNRHEEFYAVLMFLIERHFLRMHNASFSENFYGLKRRRRPYIDTQVVKGAPSSKGLRNQDIRASLLFLIFIPYLRAKAHDYYDQLGGGIGSHLDDSLGPHQIHALADNNLRARLRRNFKVLYPWLNALFEILLLSFNLAYLLDLTPFYRPWLWLTGVDLQRIGSENFGSTTIPRQGNNFSSRKHGIYYWIRHQLTASTRLLLDSLRLLLSTAIVFIKFLEWWYSPTSPARSLITSPHDPPIPPPVVLTPHLQGVGFDKTSYGKCSICHESIDNATAFPSGYVFCYRCAYSQAKKYERCPVTLLPVQVWQLRKILL